MVEGILQVSSSTLAFLQDGKLNSTMETTQLRVQGILTLTSRLLPFLYWCLPLPTNHLQGLPGKGNHRVTREQGFHWNPGDPKSFTNQKANPCDDGKLSSILPKSGWSTGGTSNGLEVSDLLKRLYFLFCCCFLGFFYFYCFIIHMYIQCLGHFSSLPPPPPLPPTPPPPSPPQPLNTRQKKGSIFKTLLQMVLGYEL
jgi:hypothetical protein